MTLRAARRGLLLLLTLTMGVLYSVWMAARAALHGRGVSALERAEWMHWCGKVALLGLGIDYSVEGDLPLEATLIVANHLSYLDIVIFSAALPSSFVAKSEIGGWPGFGRLARMGGTIFVDRDSRISIWRTVETVSSCLTQSVPVLVFPEGTSTDGAEVQRFHASLLEAAIENGSTITPAAITYVPTSAELEESDFCWFGEDLFMPHLLKVLSYPRFMAIVRFGEPELHPDRKTAAWRSHEAVRAMRESIR